MLSLLKYFFILFSSVGKVIYLVIQKQWEIRVSRIIIRDRHTLVFLLQLSIGVLETQAPCFLSTNCLTSTGYSFSSGNWEVSLESWQLLHQPRVFLLYSTSEMLLTINLATQSPCSFLHHPLPSGPNSNLLNIPLAHPYFSNDMV